MKKLLFLFASLLISLAEGGLLGFLYLYFYFGKKSTGVFAPQDMGMVFGLVLSIPVGLFVGILLLILRKVEYLSMVILTLILNSIAIAVALIYTYFF